MDAPPFTVVLELEGWTLFWAELELVDGDEQALDRLRTEVAARAHDRWRAEDLSTHPVVQALRRLFRASGCDPTRYRPASEALVRRLRKGDAMPAIHPFVDLNNCLSAELLVPCCVMAQGTVTPPVVLRRGQPGESYASLRGGPFDLADRPVLADADGPFDVPITGSQRVKVTPKTQAARLVSYLPSEALAPADAARTLERLAERSTIARVTWVAASVSLESR